MLKMPYLEAQQDNSETIKDLTKQELAELKRGIAPQNFVTKLLESSPTWFRNQSVIKSINNINFSNENVVSLIEQISEEDRLKVLFGAADIKTELGLSDEESIQRARHWETVSSIIAEISKSSTESKFAVDYYYIVSLAYEAIDKWNDPFKGLVIPYNKRFWDENINKSIENWGNVLNIDNLPADIKDKVLLWIGRKYRDLLKKSISNSMFKNSEISPVSLFNDDEIFGLYLRYYNVLQIRNGEKPLDYQSLSEIDKKKLQNWFNFILKKLYWFDVNTTDEDIIKDFEESERLIYEENQRILEEYKTNNEKLNAKSQWNSKGEIVVGATKDINNSSSREKGIDNASWLEIAKDNWLWKQLVEQNNNNEYQDESQYNEQAISIAWSNFINSHDRLKSYISKDTFLSLYNESNNTIKELDDVARDWLKKFFQNQPEELDNLRMQISSLPNEISNTKEELYRNLAFAKAVEDEDKNNVAIGSVIDNVKNIFSNISWKFNWDLWNKWFKFNSNKPVEIEWDNLMISWKFNWAEVLVRYDLKLWEIFMNSFLQFKDDSKILLWNTSIANHKIWKLESFSNILSNRESFVSQVGLLSDAVIDSSKKQSAINSIVIKFLKTFNVITDTQDIGNIEVNDWSDFFDFLQIMNNSSPSNLENFQVFMSKIMEYLWLNWGKNNLDGPQENDKSGIKNEYTSLLRNSVKDFSDNPNILKNKKNFESGYRLWIAGMIVNKLNNDVAKPNRKLDEFKMDNFMNNLENMGNVS